ncbi:flavin reductase (DIM6/NTAB) family NADH-FMN oxidoreductase RutF [Streptomyces sp. LBL]|uniref:flavin reductase family protein n=1 Tax=Streptomyces sp. LBL TaxID=2940562 RepID=UPI0024760A1A|nr:flavin reductase family protein [Streptomyces sp. LBL]MDH6623537.1 flavin reductase (DIM6/NTAB) family NADH-FMN oxidoreductase RutF [Streptomyces sp. LBL]
MALGPEAFRDFFGSVPTAVAVVTTVGPDGSPLGFTCNAFCAVSLDPALLLVSVDERSRTLPALLDSGIFALHLLAAEGGEELARTFAGRSDRKFDGVAWRRGESVPDCPVLLDGVLGHAECTLVRAVPAGDHQLLMGRMKQVRTHGKARPLLYQRGAFAAWDTAVAEIAARV